MDEISGAEAGGAALVSDVSAWSRSAAAGSARFAATRLDGQAVRGRALPAPVRGLSAARRGLVIDRMLEPTLNGAPVVIAFRLLRGGGDQHVAADDGGA
ncbi:MAG: hypothetical protein U0521_02150 [Anaerolineae bacterium]